jgi:hypothetical protein
MPYLEDVITKNEIDCFVLDTAFKVLPRYVTSIMFAIYRNVEVPIALSFTKAECKRTYELFYKTIEENYNINLQNIPVLSDQGSSLIALCNDRHLVQYFCQWHIIHKYGLKQYTFDFSLLLKATNDQEFNTIKEHLEPIWAEICNSVDKLNNLNKKLRKIGLNFTNGHITVLDQILWNKFTTIPRVTHHIPTTTSFLESTHGH